MRKLFVILILLVFTSTVRGGWGGTWSFGPWTSGQSLVDPGLDQSPFWDDSAGRMAWGSVVSTRFVAGPITTMTDTGTKGDFWADTSWLYVCSATDTWRRVALSTFGLAAENVIFAGEDVIFAGENVVFP